MNVECGVCKSIFHRKPSEIKSNSNNFCSIECYNKYRKNTSNSPDVILNRIIKSMWTSVNIRCGKYSHLRTESKCKSYKNINIIFTREEFKLFCIKIKDDILSLNRPSLDRIDSYKDYSLDNIRIIELSDNIKNKKVGNKYLTNSFGVKRGVRESKNGTISAVIQINNRVRYLGSFNSKDDAYKAFSDAYFEYYGKYPW